LAELGRFLRLMPAFKHQISATSSFTLEGRLVDVQAGSVFAREPAGAEEEGSRSARLGED